MALSARATSQPPEIAESSFRRPHETRRSGSLRGADEGEGARTLSQALQDSVAGIRIVDLGRTLAAGRWLQAERCLGGGAAATQPPPSVKRNCWCPGPDSNRYFLSES